MATKGDDRMFIMSRHETYFGVMLVLNKCWREKSMGYSCNLTSSSPGGFSASFGNFKVLL